MEGIGWVGGSHGETTQSFRAVRVLIYQIICLNNVMAHCCLRGFEAHFKIMGENNEHLSQVLLSDTCIRR